MSVMITLSCYFSPDVLINEHLANNYYLMLNNEKLFEVPGIQVNAFKCHIQIKYQLEYRILRKNPSSVTVKVSVISCKQDANVIVSQNNHTISCR